jgi:hypothetical protein
MPKSMADALNLDETDRGSQVHAASSAMHGKQGAVFHGQGGVADTARRDLEAFLHRVAQAVDHHLQGKSQPLLIAADQSTACLFQQLASYSQIVPAPLAGNYDHTRLPALHASAWPHVEPQLRASQTRDWERLNEVLGTPRTAIGLHEVLTAARDGKIEALFIETQTPIWGSYDPQQRIATVHHTCLPGDEDLAETLIQETLTKRGNVAALETREHPQVDDRTVALLRY